MGAMEEHGSGVSMVEAGAADAGEDLSAQRGESDGTSRVKNQPPGGSEGNGSGKDHSQLLSRTPSWRWGLGGNRRPTGALRDSGAT